MILDESLANLREETPEFRELEPPLLVEYRGSFGFPKGSGQWEPGIDPGGALTC